MTSECSELEENFKTLKELFVRMSHAIRQLEQQQVELERENKSLSDVNKSLHESTNRLLRINEKQRTMLNSLDQSLDKIEFLKNELDDVKKENLKLKDSFHNKLHSIQQPHIVDCSQGKLEKYNALLQKKVVDLEAKLNQTLYKQNSSITINDKKPTKLMEKNNKLTLENRLLKEQLSNLRNVHNQIISEIQLNNLKKSNSGSQQEVNNTPGIFSMNADENLFDENELQPLKVNVMYSNFEDDALVTNIQIDKIAEN